jgi:hypothetical protein
MQTFGELKYQLEKFNQLTLGSGIYFYWEYEAQKCMDSHIAHHKNGDTLMLHATLDVSFYHILEIYIKNCTEHNLPKDCYLPDHWTKPAFEIQEIILATELILKDESLVKAFTLKLNYRAFESELGYYTIQASRFYFKKVR